MAAETVVVGADPGTAPAWAAGLPERVRVVAGREPSAELHPVLQAAGCALIDGSAGDPVGVAQRMRSLEPQIQLAIVAPESARRRLERAVILTPGLGEVWIVPPDAVDAPLVERAGAVTEQRRAYRATHSRIEHELAAIEPHLPRRALISDAYLAALLLALPDPVVSVDDDGRILTWNAAAERVLGRARPDAIGESLTEILDPEDPALFADLLSAPPPPDGIVRAEIRYRARDSDPRAAELAIVPVEAGDRRVRAVLLHDVTEERRLREAREAQAAELEAQTEQLQLQARQLEEAQLALERTNGELQRTNEALAEQAAAAERARAEAEDARRDAEAANRAKSEFLATMSHEIRTPINAIVGYTDLLSLGISGPITPRQETQLARVRSSSEHLLMLIEDILDLAKVEAGRLQVAHERRSAMGAVGAALSLVSPQATEKGVTLEDCPSADEVEYVGDEDRVRQILVNLLTNAVKFTPEGGTIRVACDQGAGGTPTPELSNGGRWASIRVEDTGIGIEPDALHRIFDPFVQADGGLTRKRGGTGLGLTISRQLALLMGGDLTVESELGKGSAFTLWLPVEDPVVRSLDQTILDSARRAPGSPEIRAVGDALRGRVDQVLELYVARLTKDPLVPRAAEHDRKTLENHTVTLVTDLAQALVVLADEDDGLAGLLRDGTEIQRVIAELHGAQRARLGWSEAAVRRELEILWEVVEGTVRAADRAASDLREATRVLKRSLEHAERASLRGFRRERAQAERESAGAR